MKLDGALLAMVGGDSSVEKVIGALISNVWQIYDSDAKESIGVDDLQTLIFDCEV